MKIMTKDVSGKSGFDYLAQTQETHPCCEEHVVVELGFFPFPPNAALWFYPFPPAISR